MSTRKTIKQDLEFVQGSTNTVFTGVDDLVNMNLDPYVNGYAFIYWVKTPEWFKEDEDLKHFKKLTQKNFRQFSGVSPIELTTTEQQTGFPGHTIDIAAGVTRSNNEFTISHREYRGGIMRKLYQKWISMIRDPRTGIALYPKLFNCEYGARNHTAQLLYIVTSPDATNTSSKINGKEYTNIEYAAFYSNVFPTNVPLDTLYNFEIGNQEAPSIEITFKGFPEIGPDVEEYAARILRDEIMAKGTNDAYLPFIDSYNTNKAASSEVFTSGSGTLADIFNYNK